MPALDCDHDLIDPIALMQRGVERAALHVGIQAQQLMYGAGDGQAKHVAASNLQLHTH